jgi:hypothetical protein
VRTVLPDHIRFPFAFAPDLLMRDLEALASVGWIRHFVPQNYDGDWSVIPLRGAAGATHPVMMIYSDATATEFEDTPMLQVCPYYQQVLAKFECPLQAVRLMRLTPGSRIKEHTDLDLRVESGTARIHIPITTNADVDFRVNNRRIVLESGTVWYLRLSDPHSVDNRGDTDRVHMVIDASVNNWMRGILESDAGNR